MMQFTVDTEGVDVINVYAGAELVASLNITVVNTGTVEPTGYFKPQKSHVKVEAGVTGHAEGVAYFQTSYATNWLTLQVDDPGLTVQIVGENETGISYSTLQPKLYEVSVLHSGNVIGTVLIEVLPKDTEYLNVGADELEIDLAYGSTMDMYFTSNIDMAEVTFEHNPSISIVYRNEGDPTLVVTWNAGPATGETNTVTLKKGEVVLDSFNVKVVNSNV